ncbi:hypothetical protein RCL1_001392 [Eukaryota sp. TZLM3-RCL]
MSSLDDFITLEKRSPWSSYESSSLQEISVTEDVNVDSRRQRDLDPLEQQPDVFPVSEEINNSIYVLVVAQTKSQYITNRMEVVYMAN